MASKDTRRLERAVWELALLIDPDGDSEVWDELGPTKPAALTAPPETAEANPAVEADVLARLWYLATVSESWTAKAAIDAHREIQLLRSRVEQLSRAPTDAGTADGDVLAHPVDVAERLLDRYPASTDGSEDQLETIAAHQILWLVRRLRTELASRVQGERVEGWVYQPFAASLARGLRESVRFTTRPDKTAFAPCTLILHPEPSSQPDTTGEGE